MLGNYNIITWGVVTKWKFIKRKGKDKYRIDLTKIYNAEKNSPHTLDYFIF